VNWRDATIIGWGFIADLDRDKPYLGLAIAEDAQGKGLGKTLLARVLGWASENGIERVYLTVVTDNRRAINLYANHGFVTYDEEFDEKDQLSYYHMVAELR
jgi:RimJ/RimL family protein N-acetyltransferase